MSFIIQIDITLVLHGQRESVDPPQHASAQRAMNPFLYYLEFILLTALRRNMNSRPNCFKTI